MALPAVQSRILFSFMLMCQQHEMHLSWNTLFQWCPGHHTLQAFLLILWLDRNHHTFSYLISYQVLKWWAFLSLGQTLLSLTLILHFCEISSAANISDNIYWCEHLYLCLSCKHVTNCLLDSLGFTLSIFMILFMICSIQLPTQASQHLVLLHILLLSFTYSFGRLPHSPSV